MSFCQYGNYYINNFQLQAQQLPSHQLNTNLTSCNIPQNCINATHEVTFLESMENSWDHQIKYFKQLKDTLIHPCVCFHWLCYRKQVIKIYKTMIEKYCFDILFIVYCLLFIILRLFGTRESIRWKVDHCRNPSLGSRPRQGGYKVPGL